MGETLCLDEVMRRMTRMAGTNSTHLPMWPRTSREEVAAVLRRSYALGDCGPEPEDIDAEAGRVADFVTWHRVHQLSKQLRDGTCGEPEAARAEILDWIHEEQDRDAAERRATLAALGVPVRTMTGFGDHHVIVQVDGITVDPTSGPR